MLSRSATIKLIFTVATDSDSFVQATQGQPKGPKELSVAIETNALDALAEEKPGQIRVVLSPCDVPAEYPGFLAVDLGNTASTVACLPAGLTRSRTSCWSTPRASRANWSRTPPRSIRASGSTGST